VRIADLEFPDNLGRALPNGIRAHSKQAQGEKMPFHHGGCLCGTIRYATTAAPTHVTVCHCKFCQRATGSAYMVEPIFARDALEITAGTPSTYIHISEGSGKRVAIHFCAGCGTKLFLAFERFPEVVGVYAGTFDDPNWFDRSAATSRHIFLSFAQRGTVIPAGFKTYGNHAMRNDGTAESPVVFEQPHTMLGWSTDAPYRRTSGDPFDRPQPAWLSSAPRE
jgi:hypothetical protein